MEGQQKDEANSLSSRGSGQDVEEEKAERVNTQGKCGKKDAEEEA